MKWTRDHKLKSVVMGTKVVKYSYDFGGKRVMKEIINGSTTIRTYYVSVASGNAIATYQDTITVSNRRFWLKENVIYGSSRLGNYNADEKLFDSQNTVVFSQTISNVYVAKKTYELSNHLGNVYVTITDRKIWNGNNGVAEVLSVTDYYAYNMEILERTNVVKSYRYGLNGQEKSPELGENHTTAEFWEYDARSGRRWNLDPVVKPHESGYFCFSGSPIWMFDLLGDDGDYFSKKTGKKLGSDKIDDNKIYTVEGKAGKTDADFVADIKNNQGKSYQTNQSFSVDHVMTWETSTLDVLSKLPDKDVLIWSDAVDPNFNSGYSPVDDNNKCLHLCQRLMDNADFGMPLWGGGTSLYNSEGVIQKSTFIKQIAIINSNLKQGIPTVVGVDDNNYYKGHNPGCGSDHFITIVGGGRIIMVISSLFMKMQLEQQQKQEILALIDFI